MRQGRSPSPANRARTSIDPSVTYEQLAFAFEVLAVGIPLLFWV